MENVYFGVDIMRISAVRISKKNILMSLAVALMAGGSQAQEAAYPSSQHGEGRWPNWYVGVKGSLNYVDDTNIASANRNVGDLGFDSGYGVAGSIGYTPGPTGSVLDYTRFEFEIGHRFNDLENFTAGGKVSSVSGNIKSYSYMMNAYFDFDTQTQVSPYVGAGIGLDTISMSSKGLGVQDEDKVFAYQFMAGLGWQPEFMLNTVLQVGYRYHGTTDPTFTASTGQSVEHEYTTHALEAGARFRF